MFLYAGIDEAGYGPFFGPLTVGRCVLAIPALEPAPPGSGGFPEKKIKTDSKKTTQENFQAASGGEFRGEFRGPPALWQRLNKAVCKTVSGAKGRIPINDSKKLKTKASGVKHLERGVLCFASLMDLNPADVAELLDALGETSHRAESLLPWYAPTRAAPWQPLPETLDPGELAVCRGLLTRTAQRIGLTTADLGVACVFEDRFNRMVTATRSKAAVSFTFVASHLQSIWEAFGRHAPVVVIDRQGGRTRYRDNLALVFENADVDVLKESPEQSIYELRERPTPPHTHTPRAQDTAAPPSDALPQPLRRMTVYFETEADGRHMPVALASMTAKYTRELMMHRFGNWFAQRCPAVKPTAGYGTDAKRFQQEITSHLPALGLTLRQLRRKA